MNTSELVWQKHLKSFGIVIVLVIVLGALAFFSMQAIKLRNFIEQPINSDPNNHNIVQGFTIHSGESASKVIQNLDTQFGLSDVDVSRIWFKLYPERAAFKAGIYEIRSDDNVASVLNRFLAGETMQLDITLVEGLRWQDWLQQLKQREWLVDKFEQEYLLKAINRWYKEMANDAGFEFQAISHLEGVLMPDTYRVSAGTSIQQVLMMAAMQMRDSLQKEWANRQLMLPIASPYEALILASIIEKETGVREERPHIAAVFVNRLNRDMRLQTDPTVIYGLGDKFEGDITRRHLREWTPYNTYRIDGLPPTPIAMPSFAAIQAALNPISSDDVYFVAKGDGTHHFSKTLQEHNSAVRRYQLGKQ